jgi:hypothetical protein
MHGRHVYHRLACGRSIQSLDVRGDFLAASLEQTATNILHMLAQMRQKEDFPDGIDGPTLQKITHLPIADINDAVWLLKNSGYVETIRYLETRDYDFTYVKITALGRYEAERVSSPIADPLKLSGTDSAGPAAAASHLSLPPAPVGSPFGFTDEDWEFISRQKEDSTRIVVVMGLQFSSAHYDSTLLQSNVRSMFERGVEKYNASPGSIQTELSFRPLAAGYGEHLFNEIARDIISADIAVFDTSDLNPNVMIELGVALTWGVRVLPIRLSDQHKPPSDISGQTWAEYSDSATRFVDPDHETKLVKMVERAVRKKGRRT